MRHVFRARKLGWEGEEEGIWFDSDHYTKEQAEVLFLPFEAISQRGYPYTAYEYDGEKYHAVTYVGEYEDHEMPRDNEDIIEHHLRGPGK